MSRLSDILGVKEGQEFRFDHDQYRIMGNVRERFLSGSGDWCTEYDERSLCKIIAYPELIRIITETPELTEQQITAIKGRIAEGTPWATKDKDNDKQTWFFETKPTYSAEGIFQPSEDGNIASIVNTPLYDFVTFENSPIYLPDLIKE